MGIYFHHTKWARNVDVLSVVKCMDNNKKDSMNEDFKALLLETLQEVKQHPEGKEGVIFMTYFDEEPDWEVGLMFRPKEK